MEQHLLPLESTTLGLLLLTLSCTGAPRAAKDATHVSGTSETGLQESGSAANGDGDPSAKGASSGDARDSRGRAKNAGSAHSAAEVPSSPADDDLPRGTLVLQVGDSFAGALGVPLGQRLKAKGLHSVLEYRTSSYVPTWASGTELTGYVARYHPDLVIVTLGANEFELANPDQRAAAVRRLVQHLGNRPCVWVTPPRWKQDTGILAVIHANVKPCRFLDSDTIVRDLARKQDKVHPSDAAREVWADAVLAWLIRERQGGERPWQLKEEVP